MWYFGSGVGLDFNQSAPTPLINKQINAVEGCASVADDDGKLLFYTNGEELRNRKNQVMLNGKDLMGDLSSSSNTIIVPLPDNDSIYYLFTIGTILQNVKGFRYNVINIKGDSG